MYLKRVFSISFLASSIQGCILLCEDDFDIYFLSVENKTPDAIELLLDDAYTVEVDPHFSSFIEVYQSKRQVSDGCETKEHNGRFVFSNEILNNYTICESLATENESHYLILDSEQSCDEGTRIVDTM